MTGAQQAIDTIVARLRKEADNADPITARELDSYVEAILRRWAAHPQNRSK